jgi:protoporphyrinogen oxidase
MTTHPKVMILGAGPAGLTTAWELSKKDYPIVIWEADPRYVGGIARTVEEKGFRFDIGGHRFFSKSEEVNRVWMEIMPDDFIECPRLSRIYYNHKFFNYPLEAVDAFMKLGPFETAHVLLSYLSSKLFPSPVEKSFTQWVSNRFGKRLFQIFFKSYTEKVWGMSCDEISADWAAQRIKGLSLKEAILSALRGKKAEPTAKTLIRQFFYPRLGPGQMWETAVQKIAGKGNAVVMDRKVTEIHWEENRVTRVKGQNQQGESFEETADTYLNSIALRDLIEAMRPLPPEVVIQASQNLKYRDFLTVCLVVKRDKIFPDTWIYIHDPSVKVGRIQNYKNWSAAMVPDQAYTTLGMEYFCFEGDKTWNMSPEALRELATREVAQIGLIRPEEVTDAFIVRMPKAYPIYDHEYQKNVDVIREWLQTFTNLQTAGRNGMHRYNNQDHSMMTAILVARNIDGEKHDPWQVNTDAEYHESGDHLTPKKL